MTLAKSKGVCGSAWEAQTACVTYFMYDSFSSLQPQKFNSMNIPSFFCSATVVADSKTALPTSQAPKQLHASYTINWKWHSQINAIRFLSPTFQSRPFIHKPSTNYQSYLGFVKEVLIRLLSVFQFLPQQVRRIKFDL